MSDGWWECDWLRATHKTELRAWWPYVWTCCTSVPTTTQQAAAAQPGSGTARVKWSKITLAAITVELYTEPTFQ